MSSPTRPPMTDPAAQAQPARRRRSTALDGHAAMRPRPAAAPARVARSASRVGVTGREGAGQLLARGLVRALGFGREQRRRSPP